MTLPISTTKVNLGFNMDEKAIKEMELDVFKKQNVKLHKEVQKLKALISRYDIDEDDAFITDEELICMQEIKTLKQLSDIGQFGKEEAQILDILYKNLRLIRGMSIDKSDKKSKKLDVKDLFKIVQTKA